MKRYRFINVGWGYELFKRSVPNEILWFFWLVPKYLNGKGYEYFFFFFFASQSSRPLLFFFHQVTRQTHLRSQTCTPSVAASPAKSIHSYPICQTDAFFGFKCSVFAFKETGKKRRGKARGLQKIAKDNWGWGRGREFAHAELQTALCVFTPLKTTPFGPSSSSPSRHTVCALTSYNADTRTSKAQNRDRGHCMIFMASLRHSIIGEKKGQPSCCC